MFYLRLLVKKYLGRACAPMGFLHIALSNVQIIPDHLQQRVSLNRMQREHIRTVPQGLDRKSMPKTVRMYIPLTGGLFDAGSSISIYSSPYGIIFVKVMSEPQK